LRRCRVDVIIPTACTAQDASELYVVSPKDIVIAKQRDEDDRVTWLLQLNRHREALEAVKEFGKKLKKHTYQVLLVCCDVLWRVSVVCVLFLHQLSDADVSSIDFM